MQKLTHDLRSTILPSYEDVLTQLLLLLPRPLSPTSLTALLATFSVLFKYLLVASGDTSLLTKTWSCIKKALTACNPEVQRVMAEAWGSLLRRVKPSSRGFIIDCMVADLEAVEDACAWAIIFSCKVGFPVSADEER